MPAAVLETLRFPSLLGAPEPSSSVPPERPSDPSRPTTQRRRATAQAPRPAAGRAAVVAQPSREGEIIGGKWKILRKIGVGGTAEIYEAEHRNGRRGALKILRPELLNESDAVARFVREGRIANEIRHPGIVQALDDDSLPDGTPYLVLELLEGEGLDARIEAGGGRLPAVEVARTGIQLAAILEAVHRAGVIHRDVKPENLFIGTDGTLRLLDFGIARFRDPRPRHRTYAGVAMGTPGYMPTEQAWGKWDKVDARTDVWAAGAVLFRMLTGSYVQEGDTMTRRLLVAMSEVPKRVSEALPEAPAPLAAVIDRALEVEPDRRFQSASALHDALVAALRELEGTVVRPEPAFVKEPAPSGGDFHTMRPIPKRPVRYDLIFGAAAVVLGVFSAFPVISWALGDTLNGMSSTTAAENWKTRRPIPPAGLVSYGPVSEVETPTAIPAPPSPSHDAPKAPSPTSGTDRPRPRSSSADDPQKVFRSRR